MVKHTPLGVEATQTSIYCLRSTFQAPKMYYNRVNSTLYYSIRVDSVRIGSILVLLPDYIRAKWCLWHGAPEKALSKLKAIRSELKEGAKGLSALITYIKNNESHFVDYQGYEKSGKVFTSQLAESMVNNLVNERQKHDKRMQWSREGADAILQIRASKQSGDWASDWKIVQSIIYKEAA